MMSMVYFQLIVLIIAANAAPIIARLLMQDSWNAPLDGGVKFFDSRPLLGPSKTIRGAVFSLVLTGLMAKAVGMPLELGLTMATFAMVGDCISSFIKRRIGYSSGAMAFGLDQIPESLLPLLGVWNQLNLSGMGILATLIAFMVFELVFSPILFKLHIRQHPY